MKNITIKSLKQVLRDCIAFEKALYTLKSVFPKKEKEYPVKMSKNNLNLLVACHELGIHYETQLRYIFQEWQKNEKR